MSPSQRGAACLPVFGGALGGEHQCREPMGNGLLTALSVAPMSLCPHERVLLSDIETVVNGRVLGEVERFGGRFLARLQVEKGRRAKSTGTS
jgi:hypothetical protein